MSPRLFSVKRALKIGLFALCPLLLGASVGHHTTWLSVVRKLGTQPIQTLGFSPDSKRVACVYFDAVTAHSYKFRESTFQLNGQHVLASPHTINLGKSGISTLSRDLKTIGIGWGCEGTRYIFLCDARSGRLLSTGIHYGDATGTVSISPQNHFVVASDLENTGSGWTLWSKRQNKLKRLISPGETVNDLAFSPDDKFLFVASGGGEVEVWNTKTLRQVRTMKAKKAGSEDEIGPITVSPDGKMVAGVQNASTIWVWSVTGTVLHVLKKRSSGIASLAFSPDGKTLACGAVNGNIDIWNVETGELMRTLMMKSSGVSSLGFSPDGNSLAVGHNNGILALWHIK